MIDDVVRVLIGTFFTLWLAVVIWTAFRRSKALSRIENTLTELGEGDNTTDIGGISVRFVKEAISQSRANSWFSLIAATAGLSLLGYVVYVSISSRSAYVTSEAIIQLVSSVIITAVSALFFVQSSSSRTVAQKSFQTVLSDFHYSQMRAAYNEAVLTLSKSIDQADRAAYRQIALMLAERMIRPKSDVIF